MTARAPVELIRYKEGMKLIIIHLNIQFCYMLQVGKIIGEEEDQEGKERK